MADGQELAGVVRQMYEAYARRDTAALFGFFTPDVTIRQTTELPWGGDYWGLEGAHRFFLKLVQLIDSQVEVEEVVPAGQQVLVIGRTYGTVRATGVPFRVRAVHTFTFRDGKIARADFAVDTPALRAALAAKG